ncbi:MAG TPA: hypothetical protein VM686_03380 [Polyangiaceae bacterium]|nr:hypothetical protein [Polyangiaceae bacterium]
MKSIATTLRQLAFAGVTVATACFSAGDKDGDNDPTARGGTSSQCAGTGFVSCDCPDGSNGIAECFNGIRGVCECANNGGTGNTGQGGSGNTGNTAGTDVGGMGNVGGEGGDGPVFVPECVPGAFEPCTCSIADGYFICHPPGTWSECVCGTIFAEGDDPIAVGGAGGADGAAGANAGGAGGDGNSCTPVQETCDDADNDCDGVVDNGYVCDDATVHHIVPLTRGVYLQGTTSEDNCGYDALLQFWPTQGAFYYEGFACGAERYLFRRSDNQLFYAGQGAALGILQDVSGTDQDTLQGSTPCGFAVGNGFDFNAFSQLHYQCDDTVRRDGTLVATPVTGVVAVLDDGRIIATRDDAEYVVFDAAGGELSAFPAAGGIAGTVSLNQNAVVAGNAAYLTLLREFDSANEVMVFRVNESSQWELVRRVTVDDPGTSVIASPEGTVLVRGVEPVSGVDEQIVAYMVDGTDFVVWSEADSATIKADGGAQLLPGPLQ